MLSAVPSQLYSKQGNYTAKTNSRNLLNVMKPGRCGTWLQRERIVSAVNKADTLVRIHFVNQQVLVFLCVYI